MRFNCTICGEEFAWRRYLTKHLEVHKIYRCSVCEQRFTWCKQLKDHRCVGRRLSRLHENQAEENQAEENRDAEPPAGSSTEHLETEANGEDYGGPDRSGITLRRTEGQNRGPAAQRNTCKQTRMARTVEDQSQTGSRIQSQTGSRIQNQTGSRIQNQTGSRIQNQTGSRIQNQTGSRIQNQTGSQIQIDLQNPVPMTTMKTLLNLRLMTVKTGKRPEFKL
ncbi:Zinc finger and BTB domain-containing protein 22 [Liparis tanakae]|uniref:Zinc finger and BTB domain-containing protein 22 n=1 Tax=Liparis tanakae TaxID=230148 RepID=A0A4Z2GUU6_9TELE|nr:Zinc finger and BTB domain-containing protein 22 [Liparis tanakae]